MKVKNIITSVLILLLIAFVCGCQSPNNTTTSQHSIQLRKYRTGFYNSWTKNIQFNSDSSLVIKEIKKPIPVANDMAESENNEIASPLDSPFELTAETKQSEESELAGYQKPTILINSKQDTKHIGLSETRKFETKSDSLKAKNQALNSFLLSLTPYALFSSALFFESEAFLIAAGIGSFALSVLALFLSIRALIRIKNNPDENPKRKWWAIAGIAISAFPIVVALIGAYVVLTMESINFTLHF